MRVSWQRSWLPGICVLFIGGCATVAATKWDQMYGPVEPRDRLVASNSEAGQHFLTEVQPMLEQRCVVCHGCYDSPCQLNLASPEGVDRGASKDKVYNSARFRAAPLSRLFEDAQTTAEWRQKGFWPVLNEHEQTPQVNLDASIMSHMMQLKRDNPLPDVAVLDEKEFDLNLNRDEFCAKADELDKFDRKHPTWGMPYALPGLADSEFALLQGWLKQGAQMAQPPAYGPEAQALVTEWEAFLNGDSLKQQLMSRYIYEHWFLANLYFPDLDQGLHFKLVRSATPPGEAIEIIATRRPYDDPGVERVYYRFRRDHSTVLDKTNMPYALDAARMEWLTALFINSEYEVDELPSYEPEVAANPFIAYQVIPVKYRWRFLRDEAQFTVMNFIKGPVCRGQIAVDVIRDNFWVFFEDSETLDSEEAAAFLAEQQINLSIPSQTGSESASLFIWSKYAKLQDQYLQAKQDFIHDQYAANTPVDINLVWDGDGKNQNAALTVFRHFDSATVVKGLIGPAPKTAWLIDYPILERIHYLLVAGFDVYGALEHQVTARLYMDFLRLESEFNFLALLPAEARQSEADHWYEGADEKQKAYIYGKRASFDNPTSIDYRTDNPKLEVYGMLQRHLTPVLNHSFDISAADVPPRHRATLERLAGLKGESLAMLPEMTVLNVTTADGPGKFYTILRNTAHSNITSLFSESKNLRPQENTLTVVRGFIGSYPNAYWRVSEQDLDGLPVAVASLTDEASYASFAARFGVRRTADDFWQQSDRVAAARQAYDPIANGLFDYNRLENR